MRSKYLAQDSCLQLLQSDIELYEETVPVVVSKHKLNRFYVKLKPNPAWRKLQRERSKEYVAIFNNFQLEGRKGEQTKEGWSSRRLKLKSQKGHSQKLKQANLDKEKQSLRKNLKNLIFNRGDIEKKRDLGHSLKRQLQFQLFVQKNPFAEEQSKIQDSTWKSRQNRVFSVRNLMKTLKE